MIRLYTAAGCPHCDAARRWLRDRALPFSEVDVLDEGIVLHQALVHAGRPRVPVIEVGAEVLVGFDPERLEELLAAEGEDASLPQPPGESREGQPVAGAGAGRAADAASEPGTSGGMAGDKPLA